MITSVCPLLILLPFNIIPHCLIRYEVSNEEYLRFFESTGYQSDSEVYGWSFVFDAAGAIKSCSGFLFILSIHSNLFCVYRDNKLRNLLCIKYLLSYLFSMLACCKSR